MMLATLKQDPDSDEEQIVIRQPHDITGREKKFFIEARLLHKLDGHKNIVAFSGV